MKKRVITLDELALDITYSVKDNSPRGCHTAYGHELKPGDKIVIDNSFTEIIEPAPAETAPAETPQKTAKKPVITISRGNAKMGAIPSVSLPACTTCNPSAPCFGKCYARRMTARRPNVRTAYEKNLAIYQADPVGYFDQIKQAAAASRFFRYHVSGDVPDGRYMAGMIATAAAVPGCTFLAFSKQYNIINSYLDAGGKLPPNLKIILSNWGAWKCDNPHGLPVCEIVFKDSAPADDWKICGGNCSECACRGVGCWQLKPGETIAIFEH